MGALIHNKKASFNYELQETFSAGIELFGFEVKSARAGNGSLDGAYVIIRGNEAFLMNSFIPPFQAQNTPPDYDPRRNRKLLLLKKEIATLAALESAKGLTVVPVSMYNKGRVLKVDIAIARGKKQFDKRETIKKRDANRDIRRTLKNM